MMTMMTGNGDGDVLHLMMTVTDVYNNLIVLCVFSSVVSVV